MKKTETVITLIDDLDGGDATMSHSLILDGRAVTLDLSTENSTRLTSFLEPFLVAGTSVSPSKAIKATQQRKPRQRRSKEEQTRVRTWAIQNELLPFPDARLTPSIYKRYDEAHSPEESHEGL